MMVQKSQEDNSIREEIGLNADGANDIQNNDDSSSANCSECSSITTNEGVPIGENDMSREGHISDSSRISIGDLITPGGFFLTHGQEEPEYESPYYDSDGIELVPGYQLF